MPAARIPNTVCVASNSAMPDQMIADQVHGDIFDVVDPSSMEASYARLGVGGAEMQPSDRNLQQAVWCRPAMRWILRYMLTKITIIVLAIAVLTFAVAFQYPGPATQPQYISDKEMKFPDNYREWV